ncbi:MAG: tetratricopeptide repeat protein [Deltaproteobacteria bacterium]|nr:tetratricopeptide repeat protein [Deltaproteobacteria bacterium]MDZ4345929.1 tetratricopeptide repeat protein [Candidatus Binatia bacterium]
MKAILLVLFLSVTVLSGCAGFQTGSEVLHGRQAFLIGNHEAALAYFQSAAQRDPNYIYGTALRQGIWSYVGRSEYVTGKYPQARQTLERTVAANRDEDIARLYLGMALARAGEQPQGLKEIETGMKGIHDWLEYVNQAHRFSFGQFWDPQRDIRSAIQSDLAMISGRELDWQKLIAEGEWLGKRMEEEIDLARRQESHERSRESDSNGDEP